MKTGARAWGSLSGTVLLLWAALLPAALADTWRWRDREGNLNFGDEPPEGVQAERVVVQPQRSRLSSDEAAEQVRKLREEAEAEIVMDKARQRDEADRTAREAEQRMRRDERCEQAKWALSSLTSGRPVYRDAQGMYRIKRPPGQGDPYTGKRDYLEDPEREAEIARQKKIVAESCEVPMDEEEDSRVAEDIRHAEACEAAAGELEDIRSRDMRPSEEERDRLERFLREECDAR